MEKNVIHVNSRIMINVDVSVKKRHVCKKDHVWNPATCNCKKVKNLANTVNDSAIICDEVIDADTKVKSNNKAKSYEETKRQPARRKISLFYLHFY